MKKFTLVLSALALSLVAFSNTAKADTRVGVGVSIGSRNGGGFSLSVGSGGRHHGGHISIGGGYRGGYRDNCGPSYRGGYRDNCGPTYRPVYRGPVCAPVYRAPLPVYRGPAYCPPPVSTITVSVNESFVDAWGNVSYRPVLRTAWYDSAYGGYVYRDNCGNTVVVR